MSGMTDEQIDAFVDEIGEVDFNKISNELIARVASEQHGEFTTDVTGTVTFGIFCYAAIKTAIMEGMPDKALIAGFKACLKDINRQWPDARKNNQEWLEIMARDKETVQ